MGSTKVELILCSSLTSQKPLAYYAEDDAHQYLCKVGEKVAKIGYKDLWTSYPSPNVPRTVIEEAESLTDIFSETIFDYYFFNKDYIIAADH